MRQRPNRIFSSKVTRNRDPIVWTSAPKLTDKSAPVPKRCTARSHMLSKRSDEGVLNQMKAILRRTGKQVSDLIEVVLSDVSMVCNLFEYGLRDLHLATNLAPP